MDAMREMLLALEHMQENLIMVDEGSEGEMVVSNGVELEVEENEVAIPIPLSGPLHPNAPSALFCAFPRPASPTSSTYPVGCPSPT